MGEEEGNPRLRPKSPREPPLHLSSTSSAAAPGHGPTTCGVGEGGRQDIGGQRGRTPACLAHSSRLHARLQAGIISSGK